jgi:hypothetical protein
MSSSVQLPSVCLCNLKPAEGTHHELLWRTAHFDHVPPSGVWFHWHGTHMHVARSSERLCNYINEVNSHSIERAVYSTSWIFVSQHILDKHSTVPTDPAFHWCDTA